MNVQQITPNAWHLCRMGLMNAYLVREADGFTLVDTTVSGSAKDFVRSAEQLGAPIRRIALTHAHMDHVGSVDETLALTGPIELAIGEREAPLLAKPPNKTLKPGDPGGAGGSIPGSYPGTNARPTTLLRDGDTLGSLRVISTPGHTPGHISYFDDRDGTLYAGDEVVTVGGKLHVAGFGPWYFPFPKFATWHVPSVVASAHKLLQYPIQRFAPGHGPVLAGGRELLEQAIGKTRT